LNNFRHVLQQKAWRNENPKIYPEIHNAQMIREEKSKTERFHILKKCRISDEYS